MVLPGHLSGGYLITKGVLSLLHPAFSVTKINTLLLIGTLAGEFPDIDLIFFYFAGKNPKIGKDEDHRDYITHTPLLWLIISGLISLTGILISSSFIKYLGLVILCGSWSHLLLDSIEYGVMWLWPLSSKRYCLTKKVPEANTVAAPGSLQSHLQYMKGAYLKTWSFWAEIIITVVALIVLAR